MLVQQPQYIGVEAVEVSDSVDQFLVRRHVPILIKLLDKVK